MCRGEASIPCSQAAGGPGLVAMVGPLHAVGRGQPLRLQAQVGRTDLGPAPAPSANCHTLAPLHTEASRPPPGLWPPLLPGCFPHLPAAVPSPVHVRPEWGRDQSVHLCLTEGKEGLSPTHPATPSLSSADPDTPALPPCSPSLSSQATRKPNDPAPARNRQLCTSCWEKRTVRRGGGGTGVTQMGAGRKASDQKAERETVFAEDMIFHVESLNGPSPHTPTPPQTITANT